MTTALQPYDVEVATIRETGLALAEQVEALVIADDETDAVAKTALAVVTKGLKAANDRRVELKAPALAKCKTIDAAFKTATEPWETAKRLISSKAGIYFAAKKAKEEADRREAERREREAVAARAKAEAEAKAAGEEPSPAPAPVVAAPIEVAQTVTKTEAGTVGMVKNRGYKIVDETKIPREYYVLDEKRIAFIYRSGGVVDGCEEVITYVPRTR